jgi:hypothetical protein
MRPIRRDIGNNNPRALGGQPARSGCAYPTGTPRDDRNLVGKSHAVLSLVKIRCRPERPAASLNRDSD